MNSGSAGSLTLCVQRLHSADCRERNEAARIIWDRFSVRLQTLVRRHLDNRIRLREDEQDVLQSMYASFCAGQLEGKKPPASREELWKLLVRITMCKVVNTAHRHLAGRRDVRRERADVRDPRPRRLAVPALDARSRRPRSTEPRRASHRSRRTQSTLAGPLGRSPADRSLEARRLHQRRDRRHDRPDRPLRRAQDAVDPKAVASQFIGARIVSRHAVRE